MENVYCWKYQHYNFNVSFWFNPGKTQILSYDQLNNRGVINVKMNWFNLDEKSFLKMLDLYFSFKLDWGSYIIWTAKTASKKIAALIDSIKFFSVRLLSISVNLAHYLAYLHRIVLSYLGWCS